ncbi:hypothetical protein PC123_g26007 [Phytophthora cactorum]|nr:hypothetical protein PC123_g26007 [Phytophthora cactorum]
MSKRSGKRPTSSMITSSSTSKRVKALPGLASAAGAFTVSTNILPVSLPFAPQPRPSSEERWQSIAACLQWLEHMDRASAA